MKTRQIILIPIFLLCSLALVQAQGRDLVKLKDGSVVRGTITEHFKGDHLRILTDEGRAYEFADSLIAKQKLKNGQRVVSVKQKGYFNNTSVGLLIGHSNYRGGMGASFQTVNGYQFLGHFSAGLGVGIDGLNGYRVMPVFADVRAYLRKEALSPFVVLNGGYSFHRSRDRGGYYPYTLDLTAPNEMGGGMMFGARVGVRNYTSTHFGITLSAGYRYQKMVSEYLSSFYNGEDYMYFPVTEETQSHRFDLRFGIYFN